MSPRSGGWRGVTLVITLVVAGWHLSHAAWIEAKARLAQHLVHRAWERERAGSGEVRPWPWADTHPVARLLVSGRDIDLMVLAGASGRTMAFGPGHVSGTPFPGEAGNAVVSGHRDTHFAFLRELRVGEALVIERRDGARRRYVVRRTFVVDQRETWVAEDAGDTRLTLVTCYPFDAIRPGGPLRYVVSAVLEEGNPRRSEPELLLQGGQASPEALVAATGRLPPLPARGARASPADARADSLVLSSGWPSSGE